MTRSVRPPWYGDEFNGKPTANGELFDMNGVSGAHATLPMPSIVEVTNLENGRKIEVRLNDRGPFHPGRIIDLSRGAAQQLGFFDKGHGPGSRSLRQAGTAFRV